MTVIDTIDMLKEFLEENVCPNIQLLVPKTTDGVKYEEKYANPQVFAFFEPEKGRYPEGVEYTTPGIIIQIPQGKDNLTSNKQSIDCMLSFTIWRPGDYQAIHNMTLENIDISPQSGVSIEFSGAIEKQFIRNEDGWRDVYNLMELTKSKLISKGRVGKFLLDEEIKYGSYTKDGALIDFYPFYHLWMSFTLTSVPTPRQREELEELL